MFDDSSVDLTIPTTSIEPFMEPIIAPVETEPQPEGLSEIDLLALYGSGGTEALSCETTYTEFEDGTTDINTTCSGDQGFVDYPLDYGEGDGGGVPDPYEQPDPWAEQEEPPLSGAALTLSADNAALEFLSQLLFIVGADALRYEYGAYLYLEDGEVKLGKLIRASTLAGFTPSDLDLMRDADGYVLEPSEVVGFIHNHNAGLYYTDDETAERNEAPSDNDFNYFANTLEPQGVHPDFNLYIVSPTNHIYRYDPYNTTAESGADAEAQIW